jgi:hypothetical protein
MKRDDDHERLVRLFSQQQPEAIEPRNAMPGKIEAAK